MATNLGGMSEAVTHNVNGLLFEKGNVGSSSLRPSEANGALDRPLVASLAAKTKIPKSIPQYADDLERIYAEIQAQRATSSARILAGGVAI